MPRGVKRSGTPKVSKTPPANFTAAEKKQLELRIECMKVDFENLQAEFEEMKQKKHYAEAREKEAYRAAKKVRQDTNLLRTAMHDLELDYARLRGYVDGQQDLEVPRMVPERREPKLASYPDGTRRFNMNARYGEPENEWWKQA